MIKGSPTTSISPPPKQGGGDSLTRRASLTNLNGLIEQVCRILSGFIVSPIIMRSLGTELYGAWSMIGQIQGYLSLSDFRSAGTLRVLLAAQQHEEDFPKKRRLIGAALTIGILSLVVIAIVGICLISLSPRIIQARPEHVSAIRWALVLVLASLAITQISAVAGCTLRGCNLDYKALGLRSAVTLVVSFLGLVAVLLNSGIAGLAGAGLAGAILMSWMWYHLARRYVTWLGIDRPSKAELQSFLSNSVWSMLISLGQLALVNSDVLIVGAILGPKAAGPYASTGALIRFLATPVGTIIASAGPGLAGLCGTKDWPKVGRIANELMALATLALVVGGSVIITINQAFIGIWAGPEFYSGAGLTSALVGLCWLQAIYRIAAILLDGTLELRSKGIALTLVALLTVSGIVTGARLAGPTGVAVALAVAMLVILFVFAVLLRRHMGPTIGLLVRSAARYACIATVCLGSATLVSSLERGWIATALAGIAVGVVSLGLVFYIGISGEVRARLVTRIPPRWRSYIKS